MKPNWYKTEKEKQLPLKKPYQISVKIRKLKSFE